MTPGALTRDDVERAAREPSAVVRADVAGQPRDVGLRLAEDVDAAALPILAYSPVLTDDDLMLILRHGSLRKQETIAARPHLTEPVCDAVADCAGEPAVVALMRNRTARVTTRSLHRAIDRFTASQTVQESMVHRDSLPAQVAERLLTVIPDHMRDYLVSHHALPAAMVADVVLRGRKRAMLQVSHVTAQGELLRLLRQMQRNRRLTPTLVVRAVCSGDIVFFTTALAVMAGVPVANADLMVDDTDGPGLISLCVKAGMPTKRLPLIRAAVAIARSTGLDGGEHDMERFRTRVIGRLLTQYEDLDPEDADYLVERMAAAMGG